MPRKDGWRGIHFYPVIVNWRKGLVYNSNLVRLAKCDNSAPSVTKTRRTRELMHIKRMVKYISLCVIAAGTYLMVRMLIWSHRLDSDFSGSYACCTQIAVAEFHQRFWSRFFVGAKIAIAGCLALSATLPSRTAVKYGLQALGAAVAGVFLSFTGTDLHGWTGASAMTLTGVVFCGGTALIAVGGLRLCWTNTALSQATSPGTLLGNPPAQISY